jgi:hypothetical protein
VEISKTKTSRLKQNNVPQGGRASAQKEPKKALLLLKS